MEELKQKYEWILKEALTPKYLLKVTYSTEYMIKVFENEKTYGIGSKQVSKGFEIIKKNISRAIVAFCSQRQIIDGCKELFNKVRDCASMAEFSDCLDEIKLYFHQCSMKDNTQQIF